MRESRKISGKIKGRGAQSQPANPYLNFQCTPDWEQIEGDTELLAELQRPRTEYLPDDSQSIVATNASPDVPFSYSINPYRGCAHGCSYCYARPTHEYFGLSAGLDFETKVFVKHRAAELFRDWLARPSWNPEWIALSGVTDCYQPAERQFRLTRACLQVAADCRQPIGIVTKNALVTRDLDLLSKLASDRAVQVALSITTLDAQLARVMEPQTSSPAARLRTLSELSEANVRTQVMVAPVIPGLNDHEIPAILLAAREAGAESASYILLRLPTTVVNVFFDWLERFYPDQHDKVATLIRSARDGQLYRGGYGNRMSGTGEFAAQIESTFRLFTKKYGYSETSE
ncbi:MAG: PA0069 family radical SAM protein, partial [Aeoliella sp.]